MALNLSAVGDIHCNYMVSYPPKANFGKTTLCQCIIAATT